MAMNTKGGRRRAKRRAGRKPKEQFYGGSKEATEAARERYQSGTDSATGLTQSGLQYGAEVTDAARDQLGQDAQYARDYAQSQGRLAQAGEHLFERSIWDYQGGRQGILDNAAALEQSGAADEIASNARGLDSTYMQTAENAFRANQERNQRAALATAAGRGAAGLRAALATSTMANSDAAQQAEITRAQEFNQLQQMKQQGLATAGGLRQQGLTAAAGIRSGVAAQDQGAASLGQTSAAQSYANQLAGAQQAAGITAQGAQIGQSQAAAQTSAGLTLHGNYLGAETGVDTAALGAGTAHQANRIAFREQQRKYSSPLGWAGAN